MPALDSARRLVSWISSRQGKQALPFCITAQHLRSSLCLEARHPVEGDHIGMVVHLAFVGVGVVVLAGPEIVGRAYAGRAVAIVPHQEPQPPGTVGLDLVGVRDVAVLAQRDRFFLGRRLCRLPVLGDLRPVGLVVGGVVNVEAADVDHVVARIPGRVLAVPDPDQVVQAVHPDQPVVHMAPQQDVGVGLRHAIGAGAAPPEPAVAVVAGRLVQRAPQHRHVGVGQPLELDRDQIDAVVDLAVGRAAGVERAIGDRDRKAGVGVGVGLARVEAGVVDLVRFQQRRIAPMPVEGHQAALVGEGDRFLGLAQSIGSRHAVIHEVITHQRGGFAGVGAHALCHVDRILPRQVGLAGDDLLAPDTAQPGVGGARFGVGVGIDRDLARSDGRRCGAVGRTEAARHAVLAVLERPFTVVAAAQGPVFAVDGAAFLRGRGGGDGQEHRRRQRERFKSGGGRHRVSCRLNGREANVVLRRNHFNQDRFRGACLAEQQRLFNGDRRLVVSRASRCAGGSATRYSHHRRLTLHRHCRERDILCNIIDPYQDHHAPLIVPVYSPSLSGRVGVVRVGGARLVAGRDQPAGGGCASGRGGGGAGYRHGDDTGDRPASRSRLVEGVQGRPCAVGVRHLRTAAEEHRMALEGSGNHCGAIAGIFDAAGREHQRGLFPPDDDAAVRDRVQEKPGRRRAQGRAAGAGLCTLAGAEEKIYRRR